jgi:hypothetical protein
MAANKERTFIMVKPDGVQRGIVGKIIKRFETKGFKLVAMKFMWVSNMNRLKIDIFDDRVAIIIKFCIFPSPAIKGTVGEALRGSIGPPLLPRIGHIHELWAMCPNGLGGFERRQDWPCYARRHQPS